MQLVETLPGSVVHLAVGLAGVVQVLTGLLDDPAAFLDHVAGDLGAAAKGLHEDLADTRLVLGGVLGHALAGLGELAAAVLQAGGVDLDALALHDRVLVSVGMPWLVAIFSALPSGSSAMVSSCWPAS